MFAHCVLHSFLLYDGSPHPARFLPREDMTDFAVTDKLEQSLFATGFL